MREHGQILTVHPDTEAASLGFVMLTDVAFLLFLIHQDISSHWEDTGHKITPF